jgi:hypothetical protein
VAAVAGVLVGDPRHRVVDGALRERLGELPVAEADGAADDDAEDRRDRQPRRDPGQDPAERRDDVSPGRSAADDPPAGVALLKLNQRE